MSAGPVAAAPETASTTGRAASRHRRAWTATYARTLLQVDALVVGSAVLVACAAQLGWRVPVASEIPYLALAAALLAGWLLVLRLMRAYDANVIGYGADEYRRVAEGGLRLAALVVIVCYLADVPVARGFVAVAFPLGTLGLLTGRYGARKRLHRRRAAGDDWSHRVLVVGGGPHAADLVARLRREPYTGYRVVGECVPGASLNAIAEAIVRLEADTVAVTASAGLTPQALRRLGWDLHGTGVGLVVAPALTDIAGPRVHTRPVAGLPLIHVEEPELSGPRRTAKNAADRMLALLVATALLPLMAGIALLIRLDDRGPVIFRQRRVGLGGRTFTMYKFRSMTAGAELLRADLQTADEGGHVLFKIRRDPRVTRVGRLLRRWSLDELPQLVNVIRGEMSLVGPRPPLPEEVARYGDDVARRLLVVPGMTGLWQVSGRSDLSWEDSVRLDLYYVENWSLTADLSILWKTVGAVLRARGAY